MNAEHQKQREFYIRRMALVIVMVLNLTAAPAGWAEQNMSNIVQSILTQADLRQESVLFQQQSPREVVERCTVLIREKALPVHSLAQLHLERGVAHRRLGDYAEALADFDRSLTFNPAITQAFLEKAQVYVARGEYRRAAQMLDQSGRVGSDPLMMGARALIALQLNQPDEARILLDKALAISPDEARLYVLRALVHDSQQQPYAADADRRKAEQLSSAWTSVYQEGLRQAEKTEEIPEQSAAVAQDNSTADEALRTVGNLFAAGRFEDVAERAGRILQNQPELYRVRLYRARASIALGRHSAAIPDLSLLMEKAGPREDLLLLRASACYAAGDYESARADYSRVLQINPQSTEAEAELRRIEEESGVK